MIQIDEVLNSVFDTHINILVGCLNLCKYDVPLIQCSCYLFLIQGRISGSYTWS